MKNIQSIVALVLFVCQPTNQQNALDIVCIYLIILIDYMARVILIGVGYLPRVLQDNFCHLNNWFKCQKCKKQLLAYL